MSFCPETGITLKIHHHWMALDGFGKKFRHMNNKILWYPGPCLRYFICWYKVWNLFDIPLNGSFSVVHPFLHLLGNGHQSYQSVWYIFRGLKIPTASWGGPLLLDQDTCGRQHKTTSDEKLLASLPPPAPFVAHLLEVCWRVTILSLVSFHRMISSN